VREPPLSKRRLTPPHSKAASPRSLQPLLTGHRRSRGDRRDAVPLPTSCTRRTLLPASRDRSSRGARNGLTSACRRGTSPSIRMSGSRIRALSRVSCSGRSASARPNSRRSKPRSAPMARLASCSSDPRRRVAASSRPRGGAITAPRHFRRFAGSFKAGTPASRRRPRTTPPSAPLGQSATTGIICSTSGAIASSSRT